MSEEFRPTPEAKVCLTHRLRDFLVRHEGLVLFLAVFAALVGWIAWYHIPVSEEAVVRSGIGIDLLGGQLAGRQGLIGSLDWAPLPTLLALPFLHLGWLGASGTAYAVMAAGVSAFTVALLNRWCRTMGLHRMIRYPVLIAYQMSPPVVGAVLSGSTAVILVLLSVAGLYFLVKWMGTLDLRSLAYVAALSALALVTEWRTAAVAAGMLVVIATRLVWRSPRLRSFRGATVLVSVVPALYVAGIWAVSNWLIMGDPLFFLRGLFAWRRVELWPASVGPLSWHIYLMPLLVLVLAWGYTGFSERGGRYSVLAGLLLSGLIGVVALPFAIELKTDDSYLEAYRRKARLVDEVISYVENRYPESRVLVGGYYGYELVARANEPELFVHMMNLSLSQADRRTHGKELFLLLPRPTDSRSWEDVHLNHPDLFSGYQDYRMEDGPFVAGFLFEKSWPAEGQPEWLLLRVILRNRT